ncbi:hypothetical protein MTBBW1_250009 [Desulfamplus magnetovallimortis]|uniref:histidine kinase n=1 Tax=Desulfamplus magnetovallimortis TaxID=1246637 RepID=A0A1W1HEL8_9BACT|nr:histidine kinase dimerization/phospho-acceptor domain-containing protein [Desulfamplus magnetovallimortis]SLM30838.1 hypothetical protein MTBBW1_250009 [Desulfamplus magnetovallimortis]
MSSSKMDISSFSDKLNVLNYVPVGICIFDINYTVLFWNKCLAHWTRLNSSDIVGKNLSAKFPSIDSPGFHERIQYIFTGGPPVLFSSQLHSSIIPCVLSDGSSMIQKTVVSAIPSEERDSEYFALMAIENATELSRKISEYRMLRNKAMEEVNLRKKIEDELRESNNALLEHQETILKQERLKVLLEMAGATAHELNQPLMTLLGTIELIHMTQDVPETILGHFNNIEKSARRIADIVSKIQKIRQYQTKQYLHDVSIIDLTESSS